MFRSVLVALFFLLTNLQAKAQDFSNKGKDFWVAYGYHESMSRPSSTQEMVLYFTSDVDANVKVEIPGRGWVRNYLVTANSVTESDTMPKSGPQDSRLLNEAIFNTGIHITSDNPIVAYAHIYSESVSGATLLFPVSTLGQDYYSLNFTQRSNIEFSNSWAYVIATEDNTEVEIIPSGNTLNHSANQSFSVTLNKGQVYNLMGTTNGNTGVDLTGTRIRSISTGTTGCKKIAVFSGSGRAAISCDVNGPAHSDNLIQQVFPRAAWGRKYLTVPTSRLPNNFFRVAVSDPTTVVTIDGVPATNLINGFYYEITADVPKSIVADKPVMVAQYITSNNACSNAFGLNGDPEMIYLSPTEQTIDQITLNSTGHFAINSHYINVIIKSSAAASFTLDGISKASSFVSHPKDPSYSYAVFEVQKGAHQLKAAEGFNAIAYGYGPTESYGYNAGTTIKDLYQFITLKTKYASVNFPETCNATPFQFGITLPYQPSSLKWNFGDNPNLSPSQEVTNNNPVADSTYKIDGRDVFVYRLPAVYQFSAVGTYPVKITVDNRTGDGCSGVEEINYDVTVSSPPVTDFSVTHAGCASDSATFIDASTTNEKPLSKWLWEFGDGSTDTIANPKKAYLLPGTYNVKHTAVNNIGCFTDITKAFSIEPQPVANFGSIESACTNSAVTFTDSSRISSGSIVKWYWNFGDGNTKTETTGSPVTHTYATEGSYEVSLQVENQSGCKSALFTGKQKLSVIARPVANFGFNEVCVNDPFAIFNDSSYVPGSGGSLIYAWDFGDANATPANPNTSDIQNPQHKYSVAGSYNVSLTAALPNGCSSTATKLFVVSSGSPKADFIIKNTGSICANTKVGIENTSSVDVGRITKIEIIWDQNTPASIVTDNNPVTGAIYSHTYPFLPTNQTYQVTFRSYSGQSCVNEKIFPITVNATPVVTFSQVSGICLSDTSRIITEARETSGLPGSFTFTGKGISPEGVFSPAIAGAGNIGITYTYTSTAGCTDSATSTIAVVPDPTVQLPSQIFALEGGSVILNPVITGNITSYNWSPGTYLDNPNIERPRSTPLQNITYRLTVSTPGGCSAYDDVMLTFSKTPSIPNAFSPNGDGINDVWSIPSLESYEGCIVQVFNRYGRLVLNDVGYKRPWAGTFNGSNLPVGVYYYIINIKNGQKPFTGSVTILK